MAAFAGLACADSVLPQVRDPLHRALSALDHSVACGAHCSTCFKLVKDPVAWARRCAEVGDAQFELVRGRLDNPEAAVDDYDLVLVADRYFESLVRLPGSGSRCGCGLVAV